jgi:hypothetical protein
MSKPWLSRILQIAGTLALVALTISVYRRTDWCKGFTPDGIMTLLAGIIAFAAVIIQIRSSSRQVREQITAQRDAEREDLERQKQAVARALLFEMDGFYRYPLKPVEITLKQNDGAVNPAAIPAGADLTFPIYEGNSSVLGGLDEMIVAAVVMFYNDASMFVRTLNEYNALVTRFFNSRDPVVEEQALARLRQIRFLLPSLIDITYVASLKLCAFTGIEFKFPLIGVSKEPTPNAILKKAAELDLLNFLREQREDAQAH